MNSATHPRGGLLGVNDLKVAHWVGIFKRRREQREKIADHLRTLDNEGESVVQVQTGKFLDHIRKGLHDLLNIAGHQIALAWWRIEEVRTKGRPRCHVIGLGVPLVLAQLKGGGACDNSLRAAHHFCQLHLLDGLAVVHGPLDAIHLGL